MQLFPLRKNAFAHFSTFNTLKTDRLWARWNPISILSQRQTAGTRLPSPTFGEGWRMLDLLRRPALPFLTLPQCHTFGFLNLCWIRMMGP